MRASADAHGATMSYTDGSAHGSLVCRVARNQGDDLRAPTFDLFNARNKALLLFGIQRQRLPSRLPMGVYQLDPRILDPRILDDQRGFNLHRRYTRFHDPPCASVPSGRTSGRYRRTRSAWLS